MSRAIKKSFAVILCFIIALGIASINGFFGLELIDFSTPFSIKANAASVDDLTYEIKSGKVTITNCDSEASGEVKIPDIIEGYPVTCIGGYAFWRCEKITSVIIPNSVTIIEEKAFSECKELENVTIGSGVKSIGESAFEYSTEIKSITIPGSVTSIGENAFSVCSALTSLTINNGVKSIGNHSFAACNLKEISMPDSLTDIGVGAFMGNNELKEIIIPKNVTNIGEKTLLGCFELEKLIVETGNKSYHSSGNCLIETASKTLIAGCKNSVIPCDGSVEIISEMSFYNNYLLTSIIIPASVKNIGAEAFRGCSGLTSIIVSDGNKVYHSSGNCLIETSSKSIIAGCKYSVIPDDGSVSDIGKYAFASCVDLKSINIPSSITHIGYEAFDGCKGLTDIYYQGTSDEWMEIQMDGIIGIHNASKHFNSSGPNENPAAGTYSTTYTVDSKLYKTENLKEGESILKPTDPEKKGYTFKNWNPSVPAKMPAKNMTFTAVFEKNSNNPTNPSNPSNPTNPNNPGNPSNPGKTDVSKAVISAPEGNKQINWKYKAQLVAIATNLPEGCKVVWYEGNKPVSDNADFTIGSLTENHTYTAKIVDAGGKVVSTSAQEKTVTVEVKTDFFSKIISFFMRLFGSDVTKL